MPAPPISIQPVPLHVRQPAPPQNTQVKSISADGSVNGKNDGRSRTPIFSPKKRRAKCRSTPFKSAKRDALVDAQPLDLVEHRRVRGVVVAAIDRARRDDAHRRLLRQHRADLHRRRVRAQHDVGRALDVERVLHVARGMILRHRQRFEVVEVGLDLRPVGDGEAELREDRLDLAPRQRDRVQVAEPMHAPGQRHVDGALEIARPPPRRRAA